MNKPKTDTKPFIHQQEVSMIAGGAGLVFIGSIYSAGIVYLLNILIAQNLGADNYGLYSLGLAVFNLLSILAILGLDSGIIRFTALYQGENVPGKIKGIILFGVSAVTVMGSGLAVFLYGYSGQLSIQLFKKPALAPVLKVFALIIPLFGILTLLNAALQGLKNMRSLVVVKNIIEPTLRIAAAAIFISAGFGLKTVISSHLIAVTGGLIFGIFLLNKLIPVFSGKIKKEFEIYRWTAFSMPLLFVGFLHIGIFRLDRLILGYFKTPEDVGIYTAAFQTAMMVSIILQAFNTIFAPMISDLYNRSENKALEFLFKTITKWMFTLALPLTLVFIIFPKEILSLFGHQFIKASDCLIILVTAQLFNIATGSVGYILAMSGHPRVELLNTLGIFFLEIVFCLLFIPKSGIVGAAAATGISLFIINLIRVIEVRKLLKMHPYRWDFFKPVLAGLSAAGVLVPVRKLIKPAPLSPSFALISVILLVVIYIFFIFLLRIREEDRIILAKLQSYLKKNNIPVKKDIQPQ